MNQQFALLNQSTLTFMSTDSLTELFQEAVHEAQRITQTDSGSLFLYQGQSFHRVFSSVPKERQSHPLINGYAYQSLQMHKPFVHTQNTIKFSHPEMYKNGVKAIIIAPLQYKNIHIGILALQSYRITKIRSNKLHALQIFSNLAGITINKTQKIYDLEEALETRNLFMSVASHELKTPITTISMYTQLVHNAVEKKMIPHKKWVDVLSSETTQLTHMINELLTKQKFSLYDLDYQWQSQSLFNTLKQTIEKYQITYPDRIISFETKLRDEDSFVLMDGNKIQQVIVNILNNAVKFSPADKEILIRLHCKGNMICFQIIDHGHGIAKEHRKKIFERFYKGDHQKDGMGLGLYVAKTIIDKHNGNIKIRSAKNKGTTIQISLPKFLT